MDLSSFWQDGDVDLNASHQVLDRLLGYVFAFKVRIQSKFRNAIVLRYSNELDLINVVLNMLADTEVLFSNVFYSCLFVNIVIFFSVFEIIIH